MSSIQRFAGLLSLTAMCAMAPLAASAQDVPSYARPGDMAIRGVIVGVNNASNIDVRDDRGLIDNVSLHGGTIINPTGLTLARGQSVTVYGIPSGRTFVANEIDTPYASYGPRAYQRPADVGVGVRVGGPGWGFGYRGGI